MAIDKQDFRRALGQFATGVCIITTLDPQQGPIGVTASSFNSVSMQPPLVLWSIDKAAYSAAIFTEARYFVVNILSSRQTALSNLFASRGSDKFADTDWRAAIGGCPKLPDTVACFECRTWNVYDGGDHQILVGEVIEFSHDENAEGLLFHKGSYANAVAQPANDSGKAKLPDMAAGGGFLDNYLLYLLRQAHARYSADLYPRLSTFNTTAQEWRVLTIISDLGQASEEEVLPLVGQPPNELALTCQGLQEKQLMQQSGHKWSLTETGNELCAKLVQLGRSHETTLLNKVAEQLANEQTETSQSDKREQSAASQVNDSIKQQLRALLKVL